MPRSVQTANQKVRQGGSFTYFQWQNEIIGWARTIRHTSPQPVAPPSAIQPIDARYPIQIITPAALGAGTLRVSYFEKYNEKVWDDIMRTVSDGTRPFNDLVQVFIQLAAQNNPVTCMKIVQPPTLRGQASKAYADVYHNCVITDVRDDETIEIGSMEIIKDMTVMYTYMTRYGKDYGSSTLPAGVSGINQGGISPTGVVDPFFT